ncbi:hypothetical protein DPMN_073527 [Dreissena polymorpha]|uniref:Uncharacterized protein n=1 Tax=Dreissena polymorpha TaxID=45954 RepID=A0A9D4BZA7_DREPO|nr:hypothetical protein DPMN_073527 [Dreissena polymorpha]
MVRGSIWVAGVAAMAAVRLGLVGLGVSLISGAVVVAIGGHSEHTLNKDIVSRSEAYKKAKRILQTILQTHKDIVVGSNHIIDILGQEKLEERFPPLANILKRYIGGNAEISILNALKLIRNTAFEIRRGGMTFSIVERKSKMTWEDEFVIWKINKLMKSKPTEPNLQLFEVVWKISGMTKMLLETCRSDEEIEHLINDTIRRIEQ